MTKLSPGRALAAAVLEQVESGRRLDRAWEASDARRAPDRPWIRTLVFGTVRLRGRIDHWLAAVGAERRPGRLDPPVRAALRMGAFQIMEMGSVPGYAAVAQSVEQVKATRSRAAAGLVNAVLRKLAAAEAQARRAQVPWDAGFPDPATDLESYLTTWGSHPRWLVRRWLRQFGDGAARALVEANNREPRTYVRPVGVDPAGAARTLARAGLAASDSTLPETPCIPLLGGADPAAALALTPGVVQDPASALAADHVSPPVGALVADLCAAPGGKALALSARAKGVVAADLSPARLRRVARNAAQVQVQAAEAAACPAPGPVWPVAADARLPPVRQADVVLADVPCTGTGTLRRRPDGRWRLQETDVQHMASVQRAILEGAAPVVPPGGLLVYATCTLEPEENGVQVDGFLKRHPDFRLEPGPAPQRFLDDRGRLWVRPQESGFDGAFAARMRRRLA